MSAAKRTRAIVLALVTALVTALAVSSQAAASIPNEPGLYRVNDPSTWSNAQLAAQTLFFCAPIDNLGSLTTAVRHGIGGVAILGGSTPSRLAKVVSTLAAKNTAGVPPIIASDEEGGDVQRLGQAIYPLPSAKTMGRWSSAKLTATATDYGTRMRALGITMSFAPVADLDVPGHFISDGGRAFSSKPSAVGKAVVAWGNGLAAGGVIPVIKHWPGHGRASDTHTGAATIPRLNVLRKSDLIPFETAFAAGFHAVMVGHLAVPGFTKGRESASLSPTAISYLRERVGPNSLIVTDSLSMDAATATTGGSVPRAALRALKAGVDVALLCGGTAGVERAVTAAIGTGYLSRLEMEHKVTRILAYKRSVGLVR